MRSLSKQSICACLFVLLGTASVQAVRNDAAAPDLRTYLQVQRLICPCAVVTGSFYDWRTLSRYRSHAGLHLGYDVAMPAGTAAVAGWPGQIVAVTLWSGNEYGITLMSPSGYEVTYGHLRPSVRVGAVLNVGDTLGTVVIDHVDIKMRSPDGAYFDFGHNVPGSAIGAFIPAPEFSLQQRLVAKYGEAWVMQSIVTEGRALDHLRGESGTLRAQFNDGAIARNEMDVAAAAIQKSQQRMVWLHRVLRRLRTDPELVRVRLLLTGTRATMDGQQPRMMQAALEQIEPPPHAATPVDFNASTLDQNEALYKAGAISREELEQARAGR